MSGKREEIELRARNIRRHILDMGHHAGGHAAHMGGALSIADLMAVLYFDVMNTRRCGMGSDERDRCILSKGHASLALYAALLEAGLMDPVYKDTFEDDDSFLPGHPVKNRKLGIEFTNGSLGMGLSVGIGVSIACKKKKLENRIFVILGDGECNEGSVWEAFMSGAAYGLSNLTAVIDVNGFQLSGSTEEVMNAGDIASKLRAFDWDTEEVDGHDVTALSEALNKRTGRPHAVVMHTVKGKGFSFSENDNSWHHAVVTSSIYETGIKELEV